jgi:hypothetical protein
MKRLLLPLLLVGLASFLAFLLFPRHPIFFILVGWLAWACAIVGILAKFYRKGTPLPTIMGWVEPEKQPVFYIWLSVIMLVFGLGMVTALATVLINLFSLA